jgi:hypothetical protein
VDPVVQHKMAGLDHKLFVACKSRLLQEKWRRVWRRILDLKYNTQMQFCASSIQHPTMVMVISPSDFSVVETAILCDSTIVLFDRLSQAYPQLF